MRRLGLVISITLVAFGLTATTAHAGGGGCGGTRQEVKATRVDIQQFCFKQTVVHIAPGESVTWVNDDETPHSVTDANYSWGDYSQIDTRNSVTHRFEAPGVYPYFCYLHPGMVGAVVVDGDAPATELASATNPIASDHHGGSTLAWIIAGALVGLVAVFVTSVVVTRRRSPVTT